MKCEACRHYRPGELDRYCAVGGRESFAPQCRKFEQAQEKTTDAEAEVVHLRARLAEVEKEAETTLARNIALRARLAEVEGERDRYRLALQTIAGDEPGMGMHRPCCARGQAIAREALATATENVRQGDGFVDLDPEADRILRENLQVLYITPEEA